jgi:hypothetical protein
MSRMLDYVNGLPDDYRIRSAEKGHKTLIEEMDAATKAYNARSAIRTPMGSVTALNNAESSDYAYETQSTTSSSSSASQASELYAMDVQAAGAIPQRVSSLQEQVDQLSQMFIQQYQRNGGGGSSNSSERGRSKERREGGKNYNNANGARERSTSWDRLKISKELYFERRNGNKCYHCGSGEHRIGDCATAPKYNKKKKGEN